MIPVPAGILNQIVAVAPDYSWDISTLSYDSKSFSVISQDTLPTGVFFKSDGTKMYIVGIWTDTIYQYSLSSAWDVSTASYDSVSFSVNSEDSVPSSIFFKSDGTKMYIIGYSNDSVHQYTLSSGWDLSTASYDSVSFSVTTQDGSPYGLFFKNDGTKMYVVGNNNDTVYQYTLSSGWDLSTASYDSKSFSVTGQSSTPHGVFFKSDGTKMYIVGGSTIYQYTLSTAWDVSTASYDSVSGSIVSSTTDIYFRSDGQKVYVINQSGDSVHQYSVG